MAHPGRRLGVLPFETRVSLEVVEPADLAEGVRLAGLLVVVDVVIACLCSASTRTKARRTASLLSFAATRSGVSPVWLKIFIFVLSH